MTVDDCLECEELRDMVEKLRLALVAQDIHWAMLARTHPHLVGEQRDDIRIALGAIQQR